jgi:glycosyltransferase involved in cell wall biosynthesis
MANARTMKLIAIDCVPIQPGKGGTGSGIWTYACELVRHLDGAKSPELDIVVLVNRHQRSHFGNLKQLRLVGFPDFGRHATTRLLWVHVFLPLWCALRRVHILHKLATETPWFCPARRITTVHDFYHEFMAEHSGQPPRGAALYFTAATRHTFKTSAAILVDSQAIRDEARLRFPDSKRIIQVVPIAASATPKTNQIALGDKSRYQVLVLAKFMRYKGQLQAVVAFERLNDPAARLVLRGFVNDAEFIKQLDQRIANSSLRHAIERRDYEASADLDALYAEADVLLFLSQYEGFGLPVIEAQARGIPVVCSDIPVLREVGGDGALYVDRDDAEMVATAIRQCRSDIPFRNGLIAKGHANAAKYSWERTARETLAIYTQALLHPSHS